MDKGLITDKQIVPDSMAAQELLNKGYTIFPLLNTSAVNALIAYYQNFQKEEPNHFYSSTHSKNFEFRKTSSDFIKQNLSPFFETHFINARLLGGAFVVKPAHGKGMLQPHQDWNMVDERHERSYNLWIPLIDVNAQNGAVYVLPGSHSKIESYRGPGISSLFSSVETKIWDNMRLLEMKAGEALLYDHALVHGSPPNKTAMVRLGIVCGVVHQSAQIQLCFGNTGKVEVYAADENFFLDKDPMQGPQDLTHLNTITPRYSTITEELFDQLFLKTQGTPDKKWYHGIFKLFK